MTAYEVAISRKNNIRRPPHLLSSYSPTASSSASSSVSPSSSPSSWRVRSNYLQRVGIVCSSPIIMKATQSSGTLISAPERTTRDLRNVPRFNAPLRFKENDDGVHHQDRRNSEDSLERKRVKFREDVTVVPIPMRSEYSDRIKTKLWTGRVELCEIVGKLNLCMHVSSTRS
jgi:hypothetical protein